MIDIFVPGDSAALAAGADDVAAAVRDEATRRGIAVRIVRNGSRGLLWLEPLVEIATPAGRVAYGPVRAADVPQLFDSGWLNGETHALGLGLTDEIPYLKCQNRLTFARIGVTDPVSLQDFGDHGGWIGLRNARSMAPGAVVQAVVDSGLRGRSGMALPAGARWRQVAQANAGQKRIVCNVAESRNATDAERMVLEGDPYTLVEGMTIAALATGATHGCVLVRSSLQRAIWVLSEAIAHARAAGWLGPDVCGSGRGFDITVHVVEASHTDIGGTAPGVCPDDRRVPARARRTAEIFRAGPETAALVDNALTWAAVPVILAKGADYYRDFGVGRSIGTMPFRLAGDIRFGGVVELAFGSTLRTLLHDFGGGSATGRALKAVQVGGYPGVVLPESFWDVSLDHEAFLAVGAVIGDGGIIAHDEAVDLARFAACATELCST